MTLVGQMMNKRRVYTQQSDLDWALYESWQKSYYNKLFGINEMHNLGRSAWWEMDKRWFHTIQSDWDWDFQWTLTNNVAMTQPEGENYLYCKSVIAYQDMKEDGARLIAYTLLWTLTNIVRTGEMNDLSSLNQE